MDQASRERSVSPVRMTADEVRRAMAKYTKPDPVKPTTYQCPIKRYGHNDRQRRREEQAENNRKVLAFLKENHETNLAALSAGSGVKYRKAAHAITRLQKQGYWIERVRHAGPPLKLYYAPMQGID